MQRSLALAALLLMPALALAQEAGQMDHATMSHDAMMQQGTTNGLTEGGQSAFAAISEVVAMLETDPATDWSKVDIEALRQHLIDMDNVTLKAVATTLQSDDDVAFTVTSDDPAVTAAIRRMTVAHVAATDGVNGWKLTATDADGGAILRVSGPATDLPKIEGLGFIGVMTLGMHHQTHHLALATGQNPHQ